MSKFAVLLVLLVAGILPSGSVAMPRANILVILTDDQPTETFDYMPFLNSIKDRGRVFQNYFHTEALCCPSRTSILTGMYPHNSQVLNNLGAHGGYMQFNRQGLQNKTWAKVLNDAGYVTALQGKYLNGVPPNTTDVPAGWSDWLSSFQGGGGDYNFRVNDNGSLATFTGENYYTDVMATRAAHVIRDAVNAGKPFADFFPTHCPHKPQVPSHEYAHRPC